jgi:hypothetical protein
LRFLAFVVCKQYLNKVVLRLYILKKTRTFWENAGQEIQDQFRRSVVPENKTYPQNNGGVERDTKTRGRVSGSLNLEQFEHQNK